MPTPTGGDLYRDVPLTSIAVSYIQDDQEFIADKVFPAVPVGARSGTYWKYNRSQWFRTNAQRRAPRTESAGTGWNVEEDNYRVHVNAIHVDVADQDRADAAANPGAAGSAVFDLDADATRFVVRDILLRRELDWVQTYFVSGAWTQVTQTGVTAGPAANQFLRWDLSNSTPIEDIEEQRILMSEKTGFRPNVLIIGPRVYSAFKNHPQFIERIKYSERGVVTLDLIAALLDVDRVMIPMVVQNTAGEVVGETDADADLSFIYGKHALLAYAAPNAGRRNPSAGYTFEWTGYLGNNTRGTATYKFRLPELKADRIETESAYSMKVVSQDLAVFFSNAVS